MKKKHISDNEKNINGMSVGLSLITVSVFLIMFPTTFFNNDISRIFSLILCGFGASFFSVSLEKYLDIKNISYIGVGSLLLSFWGIAFYYFDIIFINILGLLIMFIGTSGVYMGLFSVLEKMKSTENIGKKLKELVLFFTSIASLIILILQIVTFKN